MKIKKHLVFYIILLIQMMLDVYSIFNAGNPKLPDSAYSKGSGLGFFNYRDNFTFDCYNCYGDEQFEPEGQ